MSVSKTELAILLRIAKYASEDRAQTPGATRLARALKDLRDDRQRQHAEAGSRIVCRYCETETDNRMSLYSCPSCGEGFW